ncbi:hypothetical protein HZH68_000138 [Vespula germanica]|uniref:Uncharacterized protein n=1 Tax=Vespula germanica TaxID=30212 RepID=A0A834NT62_VESGE|nr:hypothetical protein HZH68_000138 [Vespula germanica]
MTKAQRSLCLQTAARNKRGPKSSSETIADEEDDENDRLRGGISFSLLSLFIVNSRRYIEVPLDDDGGGGGGGGSNGGGGDGGDVVKGNERRGETIKDFSSLLGDIANAEAWAIDSKRNSLVRSVSIRRESGRRRAGGGGGGGGPRVFNTGKLLRLDRLGNVASSPPRNVAST